MTSELGVLKEELKEHQEASEALKEELREHQEASEATITSLRASQQASEVTITSLKTSLNACKAQKILQEDQLGQLECQLMELKQKDQDRSYRK